MRPSLLVAAVLCACACSRAPEEAAHTVDYYRAHASEREVALRACSNDPGNQSKTASCVNAREAARIEGVGSVRSLPPMGLKESR
jgi:hypothetical protein